MFEFAYPWAWALLLALLPLCYWSAVLRKRPTIVAASVHPFKSGMKRRIPPAAWLYFLGALLIVAALARPRFGDERVIIRSQGVDIILALDLSGSMSAIDVPRDITTTAALERALASGKLKNRLDVAKEELAKFVAGRPNDRIGLIGFAPQAYNIAPPTLDHGWIVAQLAYLKPGIIGDSTGIAAPLASAIHRLKDSPAPRRVVVLFTDGANNVDNRITPEQAAELGKESNVTIHTVGIGSDNAYVPAEQFGRKVFLPAEGSFDEASLKAIAAASGGRYFHAADAAGMKEVRKEINALETTTFEHPKYVEYREIAPKLALLALLALLAAFAVENTVRLRLP